MPLGRVPEAFDHRDALFEPKYDGFRARMSTAINLPWCHAAAMSSSSGTCCAPISHGIRRHSAIVDGEIVCVDDDSGQTSTLLLRHDWPFFFAFDVLSMNGEDLTADALVKRKRRRLSRSAREDLARPGNEQPTTTPAAPCN